MSNCNVTSTSTCVVSKCIDITGSETVTDYIDGAVGTYIDVIGRVTVIYCIDCVVCECIGVASPDSILL